MLCFYIFWIIQIVFLGILYFKITITRPLLKRSYFGNEWGFISWMIRVLDYFCMFPQFVSFRLESLQSLKILICGSFKFPFVCFFFLTRTCLHCQLKNSFQNWVSSSPQKPKQDSFVSEGKKLKHVVTVLNVKALLGNTISYLLLAVSSLISMKPTSDCSWICSILALSLSFE